MSTQKKAENKAKSPIEVQRERVEVLELRARALEAKLRIANATTELEKLNK